MMPHTGTDYPQTVSHFGDTGLSENRSPDPETSLHYGSVLDPHHDPTGFSAWRPYLWRELVPLPS